MHDLTDPRDMLSWSTLDSLVESGGLTQQGRQAVRICLQRLESLLGPSWLRREHAAHRGLPDELVSFSMDVRALGRFLNWTLSLGAFAGSASFAPVLAGLRRGVDPTGWRHLLLQLEVASLAEAMGLEVGFEPPIPGTDRRADVVLNGGGLRRPLTVETTTLFRSAPDLDHHDYESGLQWALIAIEQEHGVFVQTRLTAHSDAQTTETWLRDIGVAAAQVRRDGRARTITSPGGTAVVGREMTGDTSFVGVPIQGDGWRRLARAIWKKEQQTDGLPSVWIRIDARDGFFQFTDWRRLPWAERVNVLSAAVRSVFSEATHVAGVVVSSGLTTSLGPESAAEELTAVTAGGAGMRRAVGPYLERETFVIPLSDAAAQERDVWIAGYEQEPSGLDAGLQQAGLFPMSQLWLC